ncbi:hypothetical protein [Absidia glauca]|uniref:Uncharacterized protein n=1 Tax=Absidia glauca TaxID=4829 RepID=A0A168NMC8_ABSGL|nr:hypothetical protein [Absidia glauca]
MPRSKKGVKHAKSNFQKAVRTVGGSFAPDKLDDVVEDEFLADLVQAFDDASVNALDRFKSWDERSGAHIRGVVVVVKW